MVRAPADASCMNMHSLCHLPRNTKKCLDLVRFGGLFFLYGVFNLCSYDIAWVFQR